MITDVAENAKHNVQWGMDDELKIVWPSGKFSDIEIHQMSVAHGDVILALHAEKKWARTREKSKQTLCFYAMAAMAFFFMFAWFFRWGR